jgi:catechol 2,3-dioxygenase-like lactoylglutathione lyase family enzyme
MKINRVDHFVLTVADVEATVAFYTGVLGMTGVTFGAGRRALAFGANKINLRAGQRVRAEGGAQAGDGPTSHGVPSLRTVCGVCEVTARYAK